LGQHLVVSQSKMATNRFASPFSFPQADLFVIPTGVVERGAADAITSKVPIAA